MGATVLRAALGAGSPLAIKHYAALEVRPPHHTHVNAMSCFTWPG